MPHLLSQFSAQVKQQKPLKKLVQTEHMPLGSSKQVANEMPNCQHLHREVVVD